MRPRQPLLPPNRSWLGDLRILILATFTPLSVALAAEPLQLRGHGGPVRSITVSDDGGAALSGSFDYSLIHWRLGADIPEIAHRFLDHEAAVNDAAFAAGGLAVTASDDRTVGLFDLAKGVLIARLSGHEAKVVDVAVSPDGLLAASASWDRTARVWDLAARREVAVLKGHRGNVNAVAFAGPGQIYTASYDGTIRLWDIGTSTALRTLYRHGWGINALQVLPDGNLLFGAIDGTVAVLDAASGEKIKVLQPHTGPVLTVAVWPRHGLAAAGGADGFLRVWRLDTWELMHEYDDPHGPIWSIAISGDGKTVFHAGLDDFVIGWQINPELAFEPVASKFPRRFQVSEDMEQGERQFARKCSVCHTLEPDDGNRAGPSLHKLFGRRAGTLPGYPYSAALREADIVWTEETIARLFDEGPDKVTPGSKMPLQRLKSVQERDALIAFLKQATESDGNRPTKGVGQ